MHSELYFLNCIHLFNPIRIESSTPNPHSYVQQASRPAPQQPSNTASSTTIYNNNRNYYNSSTSQPAAAQYENYYSVYDDEADLYRDEYPQQQYSNTKSTIQSTYRPSTIATQTASPTPSPTRTAPVRDTYVYQQQQPRQPVAAVQQPAYNPEYDEGLIAQVSSTDRLSL